MNAFETKPFDRRLLIAARVTAVIGFGAFLLGLLLAVLATFSANRQGDVVVTIGWVFSLSLLGIVLIGSARRLRRAYHAGMHLRL